MSDAQQVEAVPIEEGMATLTGAERWLADARAKVAALAASYSSPGEIEGPKDFKGAKDTRAGINRDIKELDAQRKAATRQMEDALRDFREGVKDVLEPLTDLEAEYKSAIDAYEERWQAQRREELRAEYEDFAPDLVPLVPFDRLLALRGCEPKKKWVAHSMGAEAAKAAMRAAVEAIGADERTLEASVDAEDLEDAKSDLFTTLDLGAAIRNAMARAEQRERVRRLEEERRRREEEQRRIEAEMAERRAQQERERREREEAARRAAALIEEADPAVTAHAAGGSVFVADNPAPAPVPYEPPEILQAPPAMSVGERAAVASGTPKAGEVPEYVFCGYGTRAQAEAFEVWCQAQGVGRRLKMPTGGTPWKLTRR